MKCKDCACYKNEWCSMVTDSQDPDMERDCGHFIRAQRWIPTKEQMPENFGRYLVSDGSSKVREAIFMTLDMFEIYHLPVGWYYENHYYHSFDPCHDFFTHWMPLPEPPEVSE